MDQPSIEPQVFTSVSHLAVDTILAKFKDVDFGIFKLGNVDKASPVPMGPSLATQTYRQPL